MPDIAPDARYFDQVMSNVRPDRLPLYEHIIVPAFMERVAGTKFAHHEAPGGDIDAFMKPFCAFFRDMGYDTVSYEVCVGAVFPEPRALCGGQGPVQSREDLEAVDWAGLADRYWALAEPRFAALARHLPPGMKAVGGVGNGVFELAETLVGLECLPFLDADDPEAHALLYVRIGDLLVALWTRFLDRYGHLFAACRFGDDLGFRSSLLTSPSVVRERIIPQYRRVIDLAHARGGKFIYHSCGCIFEIMEDMLALGIDAKHSNEDAIAPFDRWIDDYGARIALLGGIDVDFLCRATPAEIYEATLRKGAGYRAKARGYAIGSGNSIPDYIPVDNYLAMVRASRALREEG